MPPPEWDLAPPASVSQLILSNIRSEPPLLRYAGPRAELSYQFSRVALAVAGGDQAAEREAHLAITRVLTTRATELDTSIASARRALAIGEDAHVRTELGGWLSGLGEPAFAAATLRGIEFSKAADSTKNLIKIAVLLGRAGDALGAMDALSEAATLSPSDAMPHELLGMFASWSDDVSAEEAAVSYGRAAELRAATGDFDAAMEDRLRAFEIAPSDEAAARALALSIAEKGPAAADEVLRAHAAAVGLHDPGQALAIHRERMRTAAAENDPGRAVAALLDAWLEGDVGGDDAEEADAILLAAGLGEMVAARLSVYAEERSGEARALAFLSLGKLLEGLASPERAAEAFANAFVEDPRVSEAMRLLSHQAEATHDPWPLVEALVRIGMRTHASYAEPNQSAARVSAISELSALAEDRLSDPYLASWALRRLVDAGASQGVGARLDRLSPRLRLQEDAFEQALGRLAAAEEPAERLVTLRRVLAFYRGRPDEADVYFKLARELLELAPSDASAAEDVVRAGQRARRQPELIELLRERAAALAGRVVPAHARALLKVCELLREAGQEPEALAELVAALAEPDVADSVASAALVFACRQRAVRERAEALGVLVGNLEAQVAGPLLAVAVDLWMVLGETERALAMSRRAVRTDPTSPRAVVARAGASLGRLNRDGVDAIEQAISAVVPRGVFCDAVAEALGELGERELSFGWTQRWLALRPASPEASEALLLRALSFGDAHALSDALSAVLAQPRPPAALSDVIGDALFALLSHDKLKGAALARRALDVLGPRVTSFRKRLLSFSTEAGDSALAITVLERYIATGLSGEEAASVAMELAERRVQAGDYAAAARLFGRAVASGRDPSEVLAKVEPLFPELEERLREATPAAGAIVSDALVSLAEARALALSACGDSRASDASFAYRSLGGLLWDLALDPVGGENALYQASTFVAEGVERYGRDMRMFAGATGAIDALVDHAEQLAEEPEHQKRRAALLIEAASCASDTNQHERALACAAGAIEVDRSRADAIVLVERAAHVDGGIAALDHAYNLLADAALGKYGRRAAHYRAARQFERRSAIEPAMRHAIEAFEAVPTEGTTYVLLSRLAERSHDPSDAVRVILRVAEAAHSGARPQWLKRAAALTGRSEDGLRMRFDILLRTLLVRPDIGSISDLATALRDLVAETGDYETPALRIDRAMRALLPKLDGPDGARGGVALARLAIESLRDLPLGILAIERAFAADGDIEDYLLLVDLVPTFAASPEPAGAFVSGVLASAAKPYSSVGPSLLRLASTIANVLGDARASTALLVEAARRAPEDDELVYKADSAAFALRDVDLLESLERAVPSKDRIAVLLRIAEKAEPEGRDAIAISALSRALDLDTGVAERPHEGSSFSDTPSETDSRETRERMVTWLRRLFAMAGRPEAIEELLRNELTRRDLREPSRVRYARDLSAILSGRGKHTHALEVLSDALVGAPADEHSLADLRRFGRRAHDVRALLDALAKLLGAAPNDASRVAIRAEIEAISAKETASFENVEGPSSVARALLDGQILEALEQDANRRGDHLAVAEFLERRIAISEVPDVRRMLRLRRAALLEQRLSRPEDAASELEAQLNETPDDVIALRFLGDMRERTHDPIRAAALWEKLAQIAPTTDEKAEYGLRTTTNLIAGGDIARARETLDRFAAIAPRESIVELRAQIARVEGDLVGLGAALEQLASSTREPPSRRAELLVEAARAAASAGDEPTALERARRAVKLQPDAPDAILEMLRAEYRLRGAGAPREAQAAATELSRIAERVPESLVDLHTFLLAEEMDVIQGGGAGMRELSRRHAEVGALPLIALGMAERLVRSKTFEPAVALFEAALSGPLRGLRTRGRVALSAADAAAFAGDVARARSLLEIAALEPDTRALAIRRDAELVSNFDPTRPGSATAAAAQGHATPPPLPAEKHARGATPPPLPEESAPAPGQLPAGSAVSPPPLPRPPEQFRASPPPLPQRQDAAARPETDSTPEIELATVDLTSIDLTPSPESGDPAAAASSPDDLGPSIPPPASEPISSGSMDELDEPDNDFATMIGDAIDAEAIASSRLVAASPSAIAAPAFDLEPAAEPAPPTVSSPPIRTSPSQPRLAAVTDETTLRRELMSGSFEAGEQLINLYSKDPIGRSRDIVAVRRQQAAIRTGDIIALARLHEAAAADGNHPFANAIEHVLGVFDSAGGAPPPPLSAQRDAPALVSSLLFRHVDSVVNEALAIVWETGLYRRDPASYGLTGVERVQANSATPLGEILTSLLRLYGLGRIWLFHRRAPGPIQGEVALLASPSVVLSGEVTTDSPEFLYALGAQLTGAMPEHALVNGMPEDQLQTLIDALVAAFGPLDAAPRGNRAVVQLEQSLWQLIPPRAERRLREICAHPDAFTMESAVLSTKQAMRRAGLFASGSLSAAVRAVAREIDYDIDPLRTMVDGLSRACAESPAIADLVRLSIRTEYAEARWLPPRSDGQGPESRKSRFG